MTPTRRQICIAASCFATLLGDARSARLRRVGALSLSEADAEAERIGGRMFTEAMRGFGWDEGEIVFDRRYAAGDLRRLQALAIDLAHSDAELILASLTPAIEAAQRATRTIPIVMIAATFPVERGFVKSLARPGGNLTGTAVQFNKLQVKSLQMMHELAPDRSRVAVLSGPISAHTLSLQKGVREEFTQAAHGMGLRVEYFDIAKESDIPGALERILASRADLMSVGTSGVLDLRTREIIDFAIQHKILASGAYTLFASLGGAMYYGSNLQDIIDRSASFVDRILRGAKPSDLPVELPTRYDLILNLKTLRAINITVPRKVLIRASEVVS